jgi:L-ascorbate metabolism protein UlaG (beta-lactamase superfamily)
VRTITSAPSIGPPVQGRVGAGWSVRLTVALMAALALLLGCGQVGREEAVVSPRTASVAPTRTPIPTAVPVLTADTPMPTAGGPSQDTPSTDEPGVAGDDWLHRDLNRGEAVIWYLGHCGFAIRTQNHLLIFDYQEERDGQEPRPRPAHPSIENGFIVPDQISDLRVRVFVTHEHADHFDPVIFDWRETVPDIAYYFGWRARATDAPSFHFLVGPRAELKSGDLEISTVNSHHSGVPEVAYLVRVDGLVIYHNGDYRGEFETDYPFLRERVEQIDLTFAFRDFDERNRYFEQNIDLFQRFEHQAIFPMHDSAEKGRYAEFESVYLSHLPDLPIYCPQRIGERFLFRDGQITREGSGS